jgi:hypothetical protein
VIYNVVAFTKENVTGTTIISKKILLLLYAWSFQLRIVFAKAGTETIKIKTCRRYIV